MILVKLIIYFSFALLASISAVIITIGDLCSRKFFIYLYLSIWSRFVSKVWYLIAFVFLLCMPLQTYSYWFNVDGLMASLPFSFFYCGNAAQGHKFQLAIVTFFAYVIESVELICGLRLGCFMVPNLVDMFRNYWFLANFSVSAIFWWFLLL